MRHLWFIIVAVVLAGCGQDYCVLGMGPCQGGKDKPPNPVLESLVLVTPPSYVLVNETVTFVTTGGTPPISFTITQGGGTLTALSDRSARYVAPPRTGPVSILLKDANSKTLEWAFVVRVKRP